MLKSLTTWRVIFPGMSDKFPGYSRFSPGQIKFPAFSRFSRIFPEVATLHKCNSKKNSKKKNRKIPSPESWT